MQSLKLPMAHNWQLEDILAAVVQGADCSNTAGM
jgi:hypothetical protein